jgi:hypothetical protein
MKFTLSILFIIIVSFAAGLYFPWWNIAFICFLVALFIYQKPGIAYITGFVSIFLLWGGLAFWIDAQNNSILSRRMATLFPLHGSSVTLILITALVGAIIGGFAALSGSFLRKYLLPRWPLAQVKEQEQP